MFFQFCKNTFIFLTSSLANKIAYVA